MADLNDKINEFTDTKDTTAEYSENDIQNNKVMAVLAYLGWLVLIPLLAAKDSKFARFHCNQGLVLAIAEIVFAFLNVIPFIGPVLAALGGLFCLILAILGIVNAANGKAKELPLVGNITILK